jgi:hypothetical protein
MISQIVRQWDESRKFAVDVDIPGNVGDNGIRLEV